MTHDIKSGVANHDRYSAGFLWPMFGFQVDPAPATLDARGAGRLTAAPQRAWNTKDRIEIDPRSMASVMNVRSSPASDAPAMVSAGI